MPAATMMEYWTERKAVVDSALESRLPAEDSEPRDVHAAMRYAVKGGGKRLRPILALSIAELGGLRCEMILDAACAIEFVHTASLILDDLPAMDDSDFRRDLPATHRKFGESTAILASLALLSEAYTLVAANAGSLLPPEGVVRVVRTLSETIGSSGLVHGQHIDLTIERESQNPDRLESIYRQKAAVLFHAAVEIPALLCGMSERERAALKQFAVHLGVAFQITDDLIDAHQHDASGQRKVSFETFLGEAGVKRKLRELVEKSISGLSVFGERAVVLRTIAEYVATRTV